MPWVRSSPTSGEPREIDEFTDFLGETLQPAGDHILGVGCGTVSPLSDS
jgi:hypothetical protein